MATNPRDLRRLPGSLGGGGIPGPGGGGGEGGSQPASHARNPPVGLFLRHALIDEHWQRSPTRAGSLPNNLHQHPLPPPPLKLAVEDLLPRAEIQLALGDGDDHLAAHDLAFHVGVGVVLPGAVVVALRGRGVGGELLQPGRCAGAWPALVAGSASAADPKR